MHSDRVMVWTGRADLHVHTRYSDGASTVRDLLDHVAVNTRLDVIAITDHDTIAGATEAVDIARHAGYPFEVIVGEEISTCHGHLVGLFLCERIPPGLSAHESVAAIHSQGGLAFAPHPFFRAEQAKCKPITMVGLGPLLGDLELDAIETFNATPFLRRANERAVRHNITTARLAALGNSDGHIAAAVGKGYTIFPGKTALQLRSAILEGQTAARKQKYHLHELCAYLRFWLRVRDGAGARHALNDWMPTPRGEGN